MSFGAGVAVGLTVDRVLVVSLVSVAGVVEWSETVVCDCISRVVLVD